MSDFRSRQRLFKKEALGLLVAAQKATLFRFTGTQTDDLVLRMAGSLESAYNMGRNEAAPPAGTGEGVGSKPAGGSWMNFTRFIGIDPGLKGAIAVLDENGELVSVSDMPEHPTGLYTFFYDLVFEDIPRRSFVAAVETPTPVLGESPNSALKAGIGFGRLQMALHSAGVQWESIRPQQWKRSVFFAEYSGKPPGGPLGKPTCRALATRLFGSSKLGDRKSEDRSEALLIARWIWRQTMRAQSAE